MPRSEFKVSFGKIARTFDYEGPEGSLGFTFEVGPAPATGDKWTLYVDPRASRDGQLLDSASSAIVLERVAAFALGCGYLVQLDHESLGLPRRHDGKYRCPCCRSWALDQRGGFELCPVCWWEDDGQDDHDATTVRGGPNGAVSLATGRRNFQEFGASELRFKNSDRKPTADESPES